MRLSTKGEYGLLACYDLARYGGPGPVPLKAIAERQGISEAYLEQLVGALRRSGLVRSVRGAQGGYTLGRSPEDITVGDVIRVLEGPIAPVDCVAAEAASASGPSGSAGLAGPAGTKTCCRSSSCAARFIWERLRDSMERVLDSISLADLVAESLKADPSGGTQDGCRDG